MLLGVLNHQPCLRHNHNSWYPGMQYLSKVQPPLVKLVSQLRHPRVLVLPRPAGKTYTLLGVDNPTPTTATDNPFAWLLQCISSRCLDLSYCDASPRITSHAIIFRVAMNAPPTGEHKRWQPSTSSRNRVSVCYGCVADRNFRRHFRLYAGCP